MAAQAFFYNAIFFDLRARLAGSSDSVSAGAVGGADRPSRVSNFLGPVASAPVRHPLTAVSHDHPDLWALQPAHDRGRRRLRAGASSAAGQTIGWMDACSLHRLSGGEFGRSDGQRDFPDWKSAPMTIAIFYAIGTGVGGVAAPLSSASSSKRLAAEHLRPLCLRCPLPHVRGCGCRLAGTPSTPSASRSKRSRRRSRRRWARGLPRPEPLLRRVGNRRYIPTSVPSDRGTASRGFPRASTPAHAQPPTLSFRRANSASTSSTWNSMIAVRLAGMAQRFLA